MVLRVVIESAKWLKSLHTSITPKYEKYSGAVEVVYGPCIAIELNDKLRDLPEFKGDLLSLNTKKSPINAISDIAVANSEIAKILEALL